MEAKKGKVQEECIMKLRQWKRTAAIGLSAVIAVTSLSGCRFGFASDPDDESDTVKELPV